MPVGGYKVAYEYANNLSLRGWQVTIAYICEFEKRFSWRALTRNWGLRVRRSRPTWFQLQTSIASLQWVNWSPKVVDHADLVVATSWQTAECLGSDSRGLYLIQHYEIWGGIQDRVDATWRLPLRKIVIAQWLRAKSEELGAGEVTVIPNAIDLEVFNLDVRPQDRSPDEVAMLWHKEEWKGSNDGLEALRLVKESRPNLHLTLFSTTKRPSGIPEWATYVEKASEKQLRSLYNRAAVFVSPSHSEGWGLPPAEAMACGAAVVSTNIDGTGDYAFNDLTAVLTPIQNPDAMARAIIDLLNNDARRVRIAWAGHELICTKFSWERSTDLFEEALLEASQNQQRE